MSKCRVEWCPNEHYYPYQECLLHAERKYTKKLMLTNLNDLVDKAFEVALMNVKKSGQFSIDHMAIAPQSSLHNINLESLDG